MDGMAMGSNDPRVYIGAEYSVVPFLYRNLGRCTRSMRRFDILVSLGSAAGMDAAAMMWDQTWSQAVGGLWL
jgi:hypothetical protein